MLDCDSPNEDFMQTDGADLSASLLFSVNFKTTPNISSLASFYSPRRHARSALEPACMLLSLFVLHQKPFKGGS